MEFTAVRAVGLTNSKKVRAARVAFPGAEKPTLTIPRRVLARFMLDAVENGRYVGQKPIVF